MTFEEYIKLVIAVGATGFAVGFWGMLIVGGIEIRKEMKKND